MYDHKDNYDIKRIKHGIAIAYPVDILFRVEIIAHNAGLSVRCVMLLRIVAFAEKEYFEYLRV